MKVESMKKKATSIFTLFLLFTIANTDLLNAQIGKSRQKILSEYEIESIKEETEGDKQIIKASIYESGELHIYIMTILNETIAEFIVGKINASTGKTEPLLFTKAVEIMLHNSSTWALFPKQALQEGATIFAAPNDQNPELFATYINGTCLSIKKKELIGK
jgi:hypothetical protein